LLWFMAFLGYTTERFNKLFNMVHIAWSAQHLT
jgi:hypothetical protein